MPKFTTTTPIKHDGKRYEVGESITLKGDDADRLLAAGAVETDRAESRAEAEAKAKAEADKQQAA